MCSIIVLVFINALFVVALYAEWNQRKMQSSMSETTQPTTETKSLTIQAEGKQILVKEPLKKQSASLDVPLIKQKPDLYNGCELTSLTMLLQYYGINKTKIELVPEMRQDLTEMQISQEGTITYWGNPNTGFVGDITGKKQGYSIYHSALIELLKKYIPTGVDLTRSSFDLLEQQVSKGIPVVVWTTIGYIVPQNWVVWDSPLGPIRASFSIHTVVLVGYDQEHVYVNDPLTGVKNQRVEKQQFNRSWDAMGKQAISYQKK